MTSLFRDGALLPQGQQGEDAAWRFLNGMSNVTHVEDVRHIKSWQNVEIDYRLHLDTGAILGVEVKTDTHIERSQNVLFELGRIHHTASIPFYTGWGSFSKAHYLLVYAPDSQSFRLFRFKDLRQAMQSYTLAERQSPTWLKVIASDATRTTLNALIPLSKVQYWLYAILPNGHGWVMRQDAR